MLNTLRIVLCTLSFLGFCGTIFSTVNAQLAEVSMTSEEAKVTALEIYYDWTAELQIPTSFQRRSIPYRLSKRYHKARAQGKYTTGEPLLIQELRPNDDFFESEELREMCLQSKHHVGLESNVDYSQFEFTINDITYKGVQARIEQGVSYCKNSLKGTDKYYVPIYDLDGNYMESATVDVNSGLGSLVQISSEQISSSDVQELTGISSSPHSVRFNIPTDFEPYDDDYLESGVSFWLINSYAVHPSSGEVFQVTNLDGEAVNLLAGDVKPYLELRNYLGMYGKDVHPKMLYPVQLHLIENSR